MIYWPATATQRPQSGYAPHPAAREIVSEGSGSRGREPAGRGERMQPEADRWWRRGQWMNSCWRACCVLADRWPAARRLQAASCELNTRGPPAAGVSGVLGGGGVTAGFCSSCCTRARILALFCCHDAASSDSIPAPSQRCCMRSGRNSFHDFAMGTDRLKGLTQKQQNTNKIRSAIARN